MGDHEFRTGGKRYRLRGYPTSPEHWDLAFMHGDRITVGGATNICDADFFRAADVHGRTIGISTIDFDRERQFRYSRALAVLGFLERAAWGGSEDAVRQEALAFL